MTNETTETRKKLEILVLEPNPLHRSEANGQWGSIRAKGIPLNVSTIGDKQSLDRNLAERNYDGIITAVSYPMKMGKPEMENGIYTIRLAKQKDIPIVLCADTYWYHSDGIADFCYKNDIPFAETGYSPKWQNGRKEGQKPWGYAYHALLCEMALKLQGGIKKIGKKLRLKQENREEVFTKVYKFVELYGLGDSTAEHAQGNEMGKWQFCAFPGEYEPTIKTDLK